MKLRENRILGKRVGGGIAMGVNLQMSSPELVEIIGATDYDFALFDCEHGCTRATWHLTSDWPAYAKLANETAVWLLIESMEGVNNLDAILEVPGFSAIVPGPFDLAHDMGFPGDLQNPKVVEAVRGIARKARERNVDTVAVLLASDPAALREEVAFWKSVGASIFWVAGDRRLFTLAARQRMAQVTATLSSE